MRGPSAANLDVPGGRARDCTGLSGPTLPPVRLGLAFVDELLDRVKHPPCSGLVGTFEEVPAERMKLVEFVLALVVALVPHRRSSDWVPTSSPV